MKSTAKIKWGPGRHHIRYIDTNCSVKFMQLTSTDKNGNTIVDIDINSAIETDAGDRISIELLKKIITAIFNKQKEDDDGFYRLM